LQKWVLLEVVVLGVLEFLLVCPAN